MPASRAYGRSSEERASGDGVGNGVEGNDNQASGFLSGNGVEGDNNQASGSGVGNEVEGGGCPVVGTEATRAFLLGRLLLGTWIVLTVGLGGGRRHRDSLTIRWRL